ncbi:hypothetical protein MC885_009016, partial [Smutsia gigantea]
MLCAFLCILPATGAEEPVSSIIVAENATEILRAGSNTPGITISDESRHTPGDLETEGSNTPGITITVSDESRHTPGHLEAEGSCKKYRHPEISDSHEVEDLFLKSSMLQEKIAMLKLEIHSMKNQKQKKYLEDTEITKEKDDLQKKIKVIKETPTETMFQYGGQLDILTSENTMLH